MAIAEVMLQNDLKLGLVNKSEKAAKKGFSLDGGLMSLYMKILGKMYYITYIISRGKSWKVESLKISESRSRYGKFIRLRCI
jgi:hypothetical protein